MKFLFLLSLLCIVACNACDPTLDSAPPTFHCTELTLEMFEPDGSPQKLVGLHDKFWTKDTIRVLFVDGTESLKTENLAYFRAWEAYCRLRFVRVDNWEAKPDIAVSFAAGGSWSYIGTDCMYIAGTRRVTMQLGWNARLQTSNVAECRGTAIHEMGHVLGMVHEHQSPRMPCIWDTARVYADYKRSQGWSEVQTKSNIIDRYSIDQTNSSAYDIQSVMHYEFNPAHVRGGCAINTVRRLALSPADQSHIATVYPARAVPPPPATGGDIISIGKPASQSTTYSPSYGPGNANDGNRSTFCHTLAEPQPWYEIDLTATSPISRIVVYNRPDCCQDRLHRFEITIDGQTAYKYLANPSRWDSVSIPISRQGRYVRLAAVGTPSMYLHLAELAVYGQATALQCKDTVYRVPVVTYSYRDSTGRVCR
jgi:serralysin